MAEAERTPQSFRDLAEQIGETDAWTLVEAWGGARHYIPRDPGPDHPLSRIFGAERAKAVAALLGAGHIEIPMMRRARVLRLAAKGYSAPDIAHRVGITDVRVRQILKHARESRQPDLFA